MKHVKITPDYQKPYAFSVGTQKMTFENRRKAIAEADIVSRDLSEILSDLNGLYSEYFIHLRRMWILECPAYQNLDKIRDGIDYYLNRIAAGHGLSKPVDNMITVIESLRMGYKEISRFYQTRNHSVLKSEIRNTIDQLNRIEDRLQIYNRKIDSFLFLEKSVKCK